MHGPDLVEHATHYMDTHEGKTPLRGLLAVGHGHC